MDLRRLLHGRPLALPAPLDTICERWFRLPGRIRTLLGVLLLALTVATVQHRAAAV